jgi:hypothetical protein
MLSERLFEDILIKYTELIENKLTFIGRQVTYFGKRIDILFEDRFKEKLIVELKIGNLQRNALSQVMEYEGYILSEKDPSARVMIIANRIPLNLKKAMDHHGIEHREITYKQIFEFLEQRDSVLLHTLVDQQISKEKVISETKSTINEPYRFIKTENHIIGTVVNCKASKDVKDRFEIWFNRDMEEKFPYGKTTGSEGRSFKKSWYLQ